MKAKTTRIVAAAAGVVVVALAATLLLVARQRGEPGDAESAGAETTAQAEAELKEETFGLIERLITEFPSDAYPLALMGTAHNSYGNTIGAEEWWRKCLELAPTRADVYSVLATEAIRKAEYDKVEELTLKAEAIDPNLPGIHRFYGEALMEMGRLDEALAALERELSITDEESATFLLIGKVQLQREEYEKAIDAYNHARQLRPSDSRPHYGLATAAARMGRHDEARKHMEDFSRLRAAEDEFLTTRRRAGGRPPRGARILAETLVDAGKLYDTHKLPARAEECWMRAAAVDPTNTAARLELVGLYRRDNRAADALEVCEQLREIDPGNAKYELSTGILLAQQNRFPEAEEALRQAVENAPDFAAARRGLVEFLLFRNSKLPEARMLAQQLVELAPNARHYSLLAQACYRNQDRDGALAAMRRAVELDPDNEQLRQSYEQLQEAQ